MGAIGERVLLEYLGRAALQLVRSRCKSGIGWAKAGCRNAFEGEGRYRAEALVRHNRRSLAGASFY
jgi:hypothetical protein